MEQSGWARSSEEVEGRAFGGVIMCVRVWASWWQNQRRDKDAISGIDRWMYNKEVFLLSMEA